METIDGEKFLSLSQNSGKYPVIGSRSRLDKRKCFFTQTVIKMWNSLLKWIWIGQGIDSLERGLDGFIEEKLAMVINRNLHI